MQVQIWDYNRTNMTGNAEILLTAIVHLILLEYQEQIIQTKDFGDNMTPIKIVMVQFQVHNYGAGQTLLSHTTERGNMNRIGNQIGNQPDWMKAHEKRTDTDNFLSR
jgi:hypothetical protein